MKDWTKVIHRISLILFLWTPATHERWTVFGNDIGHPLRIPCDAVEMFALYLNWHQALGKQLMVRCYSCMYHLYHVGTEDVLREAHHNNADRGSDFTGFWLLQESCRLGKWWWLENHHDMNTSLNKTFTIITGRGKQSGQVFNVTKYKKK